MNSFQTLELKKKLLQAIADLGFNEPTETNKSYSYLAGTNPSDFIGLAQTAQENCSLDCHYCNWSTHLRNTLRL